MYIQFNKSQLYFFFASTVLHQFKFLKCHIGVAFINSLEKCYLNNHFHKKIKRVQVTFKDIGGSF